MYFLLASLFIKNRIALVPGNNEHYVRSAKISDDGRYLSALYGYQPSEHKMRLFESPGYLKSNFDYSQEIAFTLQANPQSVVFSPTESPYLSQQLIATTYGPGSEEIDLCHINENRTKVFCSLSFDNATCSAFSWNGRLFAAGNANGDIAIWRCQEDVDSRFLPVQVEKDISDSPITSIVFDGTASSLFAACKNGQVIHLQLTWNFMDRSPQIEIYDSLLDDFECTHIACHQGAYRPCVFAGAGNKLKTLDVTRSVSSTLTTRQRLFVGNISFHKRWQVISVVGDKTAELIHTPTDTTVKEVMRPKDLKFLTAKLIGRTFLVIAAESKLPIKNKEGSNEQH